MTDTDYEAISLRLTELRQHLPMLATQYPGEAFWDAYAAVVDPILEDAGRISDDAYDAAFLFQNAILSEAGLIAGDEIQT
ncbi:hypothetical protein A7A76_07885 [Lysobacter enzymogenes]|uniref:hypothetical protein n=1 Tax=Lysobacter enzymogenes TaxID=69 RepID=UPI0019D1D479|nr:hypothetical protein [Lysobacter enzymogenes]MBN7139014.1 hypothetical protein [Lysobacter enzymogenes]